ncbi:hypothetical protein ACH5RR_026260 [Cinchona calisaya]|uniref:Uncharacterized protein n=1 Tax=Cinchona calisaya TaxID=153742 RepID=A0ABD2Z738_9GENT
MLKFPCREHLAIHNITYSNCLSNQNRTYFQNRNFSPLSKKCGIYKAQNRRPSYTFSKAYESSLQRNKRNSIPIFLHKDTTNFPKLCTAVCTSMLTGFWKKKIHESFSNIDHGMHPYNPSILDANILIKYKISQIRQQFNPI